MFQLPPPLRYEIPPTVPGLMAQTQHWLLYHLQATISSNVHYENQLYGVMNSLLLSAFLLQRQFMIIPQGLLRKALNEEEEWELANVSFGSSGGVHESRNLRALH